MKNKRVYAAIANAIEKCGKEHGFPGRKHIAEAIGLQGDNADKQLSAILNTTSCNPANPKRMSIDMFIDIAYELDDNFTLMMLNALAEEFGFCVSKQKESAETDTKEIYRSVLALAHEHGELSHAINESLKDGEITEKEKLDLLKELADVKAATRKIEEALS